MMLDIYQTANVVVVWLGKATATTKDAMDLVIRLHSIMIERNTTLEPGSLRIPFRQWESGGLPAHADPTWDALLELLQRPWFTRIWIIREVWGAKRSCFLCGGELLDATRLLRLRKRFSIPLTFETWLLREPRNWPGIIYRYWPR